MYLRVVFKKEKKKYFLLTILIKFMTYDIFEKFFQIGYKPEGDFPNGEYELVQVLELSEFGEKVLTIGGIGIATLVILFLGIGIAILCNQRKIRKELRQLREMMEKEEMRD